LPLAKQLWQESIQQKKPFEMDLRLKGADDVFRWFLTSVKPMVDQNGAVTAATH
jgi:hypothetical protein